MYGARGAGTLEDGNDVFGKNQERQIRWKIKWQVRLEVKFGG
jgi:hypothetical protein